LWTGIDDMGFGPAIRTNHDYILSSSY
jgi:hypothetical protein